MQHPGNFWCRQRITEKIVLNIPVLANAIHIIQKALCEVTCRLYYVKTMVTAAFNYFSRSFSLATWSEIATLSSESFNFYRTNHLQATLTWAGPKRIHVCDISSSSRLCTTARHIYPLSNCDSSCTMSRYFHGGFFRPSLSGQVK